MTATTRKQPPRAQAPPLHDYQRLPPSDLEAEMGLLGSMMLDRECIGLVIQVIPREESHRLYRPDHRKLYELLAGLYETSKPVDYIVVRGELERLGLLGEITEDYLGELVESVPSAAHAEHYARQVRDKGLLRDLISAGVGMVESAYSSRDDASVILDEAETALFAVTEKRVRNQAVLLNDALKAAFAHIDASDGQYVTGVPSGFVELDDLTSGFQPGELIIIAARPSMGKTAMGLCLAEHVAVDEKKPVAFFSMEMGRQQIAQRLLCARGRVDSHKLRRNMLNADELIRVKDTGADLAETPLYIDDTPGMSVMELRAKARRLKMLNDVAIVYVDYLQLMRDPASAKENRQSEVASISRGLKALARELNIPVIALAQLNRNPEGRDGNRPRMSDLRESGAIEQDADVIMLLHRGEYYKPDDPDLKNKAEIIVAKQRNGPIGSIMLHFDQRYTRFDNLSVCPEPIQPPRSDDYVDYTESGGREF